MTASFSNKYKSLSELSTELIARFLPADSPLSQAISYSALAPGKRFRPVLALLSGELFGLDRRPHEQQLLYKFAAALEFTHASTLIHDDLPALDNDSLRRGLPTSHIKFGEDVAVLAGDALFGLAVKILGSGFDSQFNVENTGSSPSPRELAGALSELLSDAYFQICEGQYLDLHPLPAAVGAGDRELIFRHSKKTGALIAAAASGPALIANAPDEKFQLLRQFGFELGLLFQITDDLLDATSTTEQLGKDANRDREHGRVTFVTMFGVDGASKQAAVQAEAARSTIDAFGHTASDLRQLVSFVLNRSH